MHKTALKQTVVVIIKTNNPWNKDPKQQQEPNRNPMHDEHAKYKNKPRPHMVKVMLKISKKKEEEEAMNRGNKAPAITQGS